MKKYILGIFTVAFAVNASAGIKDSIGQKIIDGKKYVMYKVDAKETLYSLSKSYNTSVDAIKLANDGLTSGLKKGSTIFIPSNVVVASTPKTDVSLDAIDKVQAIHIVGDDETLYSISKKYNVTVDEIKKWNGLTDNAISKGQELKLSKSKVKRINVVKSINGLDNTVLVTDPDARVLPDQSFTKIDAPGNGGQAVTIDKTVEYAIDSSLYGEEVTETKDISKIGEIGVDQSKNLAQMTGVKVGTILMVVNPSNNKATFVRVVNGTVENGIQVTTSVLNALDLSSSSESKVKVSYTK